MSEMYQQERKIITKSAKLRQYGKVYTKYMKDKSEPSPQQKIRRRRTRRRKIREPTPPQKTKPRKKKNAYQKFLSREIKKSKYDNVPGSKRLELVAVEWDKYKRKKKREKRDKRNKREKRGKKVKK